MSRSIGGYDQGEIRNVPRRQPGVVIGVRPAEVRSGGLEIGSFAFRDLVNVQRMLTRRKSFDVEFDLHTVRRFGKDGGPNALPFAVLDIYCDWLGCRRAVGAMSGSTQRKEK